MKKVVIFTIACMLLTWSCQQEEQEEVYSCDKRLNEWAHSNLRSIRTMDREAWLKLEEPYKRPAFNALTPEQKIVFWKDKLNEVMTSLIWNEAEKEHLMVLYRYLEEHPDMYTKEVYRDSLAHDAFARFAYRWRNDAYIDLNWSEELVYAIACTGHRLKDKAGNYETVLINRMSSSSEQPCNCNSRKDPGCKAGGCDNFWTGTLYNESYYDGISYEEN